MTRIDLLNSGCRVARLEGNIVRQEMYSTYEKSTKEFFIGLQYVVVVRDFFSATVAMIRKYFFQLPYTSPDYMTL